MNVLTADKSYGYAGSHSHRVSLMLIAYETIMLDWYG